MFDNLKAVFHGNKIVKDNQSVFEEFKEITEEERVARIKKMIKNFNPKQKKDFIKTMLILPTITKMEDKQIEEVKAWVRIMLSLMGTKEKEDIQPWINKYEEKYGKII